MYFHIDLMMTHIPKDEKKEFSFDVVGPTILERFRKLSQDNTAQYFHSPTKELLYVMKIDGIDNTTSMQEYGEFIKDNKEKFVINNALETNFGGGIILNDYETFAEKVIYSILAF